jgi:hypothetical protein
MQVLRAEEKPGKASRFELLVVPGGTIRTELKLCPYRLE